MSEYLKRKQLFEIGATMCEVLDAFPHRNGYSEKHLDLLLYQLLRAEGFKSVKVQVPARAGTGARGQGRRQQIDFRVGTTNRVYLEFAVRRRIYQKGNQKKWTAGGHRLKENKAELIKLTRETVAKARYLFILDIAGTSVLPVDTMKAEFQGYTSSAAFAKDQSVTVVYVHPKQHWAFTC